MPLITGAQSGLSGAASGAAIGSAIPVIGTGVGAAVGGLIGSITGLRSGRRRRRLERRRDRLTTEMASLQSDLIAEERTLDRFQREQQAGQRRRQAAISESRIRAAQVMAGVTGSSVGQQAVQASRTQEAVAERDLTIGRDVTDRMGAIREQQAVVQARLQSLG